MKEENVKSEYQRKVDKSLIPTCNIMGVNIAAINMNWLLKYIDENLSDIKGDYICVSNVHAYEEADSLRSLADELNISLLKLRKLLITADVFTSDICTEINDLHQSGKEIPEIMKLTGLSRASVHSYLPYTKGIYNAAEISLNAERCRTYKNRQEQVRLLQEIPSKENLWQAVIAFQEYPFKTATGLPFRYKRCSGPCKLSGSTWLEASGI